MVTKRRACYTKERLLAAWKAVEDGMSIYKASQLYGIPKQTLGDRKSGKIRNPQNVGSGKRPTFERDHEKKLVSQIKYLAGLGYGYSRAEVMKLATDYAHSLSVLPLEKSLSNGWLSRFFERWPEIQSVRPRSAREYRRKGSTPDDVKKYFSELKTMMDKYTLHRKPHCIYSVDEIAINVYSKSHKVVPFRRSKCSANTSTKSLTASVIACGNAVGSSVPPFLLFKGKTLPSDLLQRCTPGSDVRISDTGLSNKVLFMDFIKNHFLKFTMGFDADHKLLLYDGHASHIDISLIEWAKELNVILFVLPPHAAHLPLDVGCFGHLKRTLQAECERNPTETVSLEGLAECVCKAYPKAFCHENLVAGYQKTGIYPLESFDIDSNDFSESAAEADTGSPGNSKPADEEDEPTDGDSELTNSDG